MESTLSLSHTHTHFHSLSLSRSLALSLSRALCLSLSLSRCLSLVLSPSLSDSPHTLSAALFIGRRFGAELGIPRLAWEVEGRDLPSAVGVHNLR